MRFCPGDLEALSDRQLDALEVVLRGLQGTRSITPRTSVDLSAVAATIGKMSEPELAAIIRKRKPGLPIYTNTSGVDPGLYARLIGAFDTPHPHGPARDREPDTLRASPARPRRRQRAPDLAPRLSKRAATALEPALTPSEAEPTAVAPRLVLPGHDNGPFWIGGE